MENWIQSLLLKSFQNWANLWRHLLHASLTFWAVNLAQLK